VLVSPRRDDIPEWPVPNGADPAEHGHGLLLGLAGEIVASGREDREFLVRCCSGADELLAYLKGATDGVPKTAEWAAGITGLDAESIRALSRAVCSKALHHRQLELQRRGTASSRGGPASR